MKPAIRLLTLLGQGGGLPSWITAGGISLSNVVAAYQPKGAASLAASYTNLVNPGTYDATPGVAPTWDTVNGWKFNGTTQYLDTGIVPSIQQDWTVVTRYSYPDPNSAFCSLFGCSPASNVGMISAIVTSDVDDTYYYYNGSFLVKTQVRTVLEGVIAIAGNKAYFNGVAESGTISADATVNDRSLYIGTHNNIGAAFFGASMASRRQAFAIYNTVLTAPQVLAVTNAMNQIRGSSYQAVFEGDSLTLGKSPAQQTPYPSQVSTLLSMDWWNLGVDGKTMNEPTIGVFVNATAFDSHYNSGYSRNVAVLWIGFNDIFTGGRTGAQVFADIVTWCTARKAAGWKTVVLTIHPVAYAGWDTEEAERLALNALINGGDSSIDQVADVSALAHLQNPADATYFQDGVHLTTAGYADVAALVATKI